MQVGSTNTRNISPRNGCHWLNKRFSRRQVYIGLSGADSIRISRAGEKGQKEGSSKWRSIWKGTESAVYLGL